MSRARCGLSFALALNLLGCGPKAPPPVVEATPAPVPAGAVVPQSVYGDPQAPVAGQVLGTVVRTADAEELRYVILQRLTDRYAQAQGIVVTQVERDDYVAHMLAALRNDPNTREALGAGDDTDEDRAAREEIAGASILQWKISRALYQQYGGRIVFQQGGPEPLDAYRTFLEECQARGDFQIASPALEAEFWRYYRTDAIHSFYPSGSPEEARALVAPPWLAD